MAHDYRDVLLKAASIVEQAWCQRRFHQYDDEDAVVASCAVGAIERAAIELFGPDGTGRHFDPEWYAINALSEQVNRHIPHWNDEPGRTADQVAQAMREAASS